MQIEGAHIIDDRSGIFPVFSRGDETVDMWCLPELVLRKRLVSAPDSDCSVLNELHTVAPIPFSVS